LAASILTADILDGQAVCRGNKMIRINENIGLDESEISLSFIHSGGPGGQNVNKVASAVQLRFDVVNSPSLSEGVRERLKRLAGRRLNRQGVLVITANRQRTQEANRREAIERLVELIRQAAIEPKPRLPARRSKAKNQRRLENKARHSHLKNMRRKPDIED